MQERTFELQTEYIELIKLLKATHVAATGGHAKMLVEEGLVTVNGKQEFRKRAKIRKGDQIDMEEIRINIV